MNKCYSLDEETYNMNELREVFETLQSEDNFVVGHEYHEADAIPYTSNVLVENQLEHVLEGVDERISEELGECWDSELNGIKFTNPVAYKELEEFFVGWFDKNTRVNQF